MSSKLLCTSLVVLSLQLAGCGILGEKVAALKTMAYSGTSIACLDGFSGKIKDYTQGKVTDSEWSASLDCVNDNLETFQKFVKPSDLQGYSVADMQLFVSRFILTTGPVSRELVQAGFELKAALLGGSTQHISPPELEILLSNLSEIKNISLELLREIRILNQSPSDEDLIRLSDRAREAGERMAALLPREAYAALSLNSVRVLIEECRRFGIELDPKLADLLMAAKVLFLGGSDVDMDPDSWREMARMGGQLAGPFWIATRTPLDAEGKAFFERRPIFSKLLSDVSRVASQAMGRHQGKWNLALFDRLIDSAPEGWFPWDRQILKQSLRPAARKFLKTSEPEIVRPGGVAILMGLADRWSRGTAHVNAIFRRLGRNSLPWQNLIDFTVEYVNGIQDSLARQDADRLLAMLRDYQPIYAQGAKQVRFEAFQEYSKDQLTLLNLLNLMAVHFLESYGSAPVTSWRHVTKAEMQAFFDDFLPLAGQFKILDPTAADVAGKRFRDMDLFTLASDGDGKLSEREVTYFLLYAASISGLSDRIAAQAIPPCPVTGPDSFGTVFVEVSCFESYYYGDRSNLWDHFPGLLGFYDGLSSANQKDTRSQMAVAARRYGDTSQPVGAFDIQGLAGLNHYVESLMFRFDRDRNGILVLDEVMLAYPMFKKLLAELGELDPNDDGTIQAVFTYIVKYQKIPKRDAHFIWWLLTKPFWKVEATRSALFNLISQVSTPEPVPSP